VKQRATAGNKGLNAATFDRAREGRSGRSAIRKLEGRLQNLFDGETRHAEDGWLLSFDCCCATAPWLIQPQMYANPNHVPQVFHLSPLIINPIVLSCLQRWVLQVLVGFRYLYRFR
jgi:hypothetical protein